MSGRFQDGGILLAEPNGLSMQNDAPVANAIHIQHSDLLHETAWPWVSIFLSALGSLLVLGLALWIQQTIMLLLGRGDWFGWIATVMFAVATVAFVMLTAREISGLRRLLSITSLRRRAEAALINEDALQARAAASQLSTICRDRPGFAEAITRLNKRWRDTHDAKKVLALTERELLLPLDQLARQAIGISGRRVSVVTSLSPTAILTVSFIAYQNFHMLRCLATVYGGRPSFLAILRILRLVARHLAVTGGIAFTEDLLHQFLGQGLTARLSRRLGEGLISGCFTIRIGIAAIEVLRPLPYIEARRPRLRQFAFDFLKFGQRQQAFS
jgi:putative membrane protein